MRPKKRETTGSSDLFRARLDQIINMKHGLVQLAGKIDWIGSIARSRPPLLAWLRALLRLILVAFLSAFVGQQAFKSAS
jgi:hypothetical protein